MSLLDLFVFVLMRYSSLQPIYEGLACGEETVLRKKAADGMCSLASVMSGEHVNIHLMTVIRRLASGILVLTKKKKCAQLLL